jgi:alanyl-tRNA synthetase
MERTEKLYYERPDLFSCDATVAAVEGSPAGKPESPVIFLDKTIFYPEGGGQACDSGAIGALAGEDAIRVSSVAEKGGRVLHKMALPEGAACPFRPGDRVRLLVDRDHRIDYSQQHTAEHLIGATALRLIGAHVVSVRFGAERSLIDFDAASISDDDLAAIEDEVDRIIADDYAIRTHLCPPEDLSSFPLRRRPPAGEEELRIVEIDGIDFSPCCGLHMSSTGKLRAVRLFGSEKYKGMSRVYFAAGARAAADYRAVSRIARESARALGTSEAELSQAVSREAGRRRDAELALGSLERELAALEAASAPERAEAGTRLALRRYMDREASSLMTTAKAFSEAGMIALLASVPGLTVQALAPSAEARLGEKLKSLLDASEGKGGGGPASFRAVFKDSSGLERFLKEASSALNC